MTYKTDPNDYAYCTKPETVIEISDRLSRQVGTETVKAVLGAFIMTEEGKSLVADAEIGRMFLKVAGRNRKEIQDTIEFWGMNRPDDSAIDAARAGHE